MGGLPEVKGPCRELFLKFLNILRFGMSFELADFQIFRGLAALGTDRLSSQFQCCTWIVPSPADPSRFGVGHPTRIALRSVEIKTPEHYPSYPISGWSGWRD
jgi:hypothetical protein